MVTDPIIRYTEAVNRRDCLKRAAGAMASLAASRRAPAAPARPNILLFIGDDWWRTAGAYRDPRRPSLNDAVRTPNIDRVAGEGVLFTNAFVSAPSCTPSRAAIATGCHFWRTGKTANLRSPGFKGRPDPGDALPGAGRLLEQSGYHVRTAHKTLDPRWTGGASHKRGKTQRAEAAAGLERIRQTARADMRRVLAERPPDAPFFYIYGPIDAHRPWPRGSGRALWGLDPDSLRGKLPRFLPDVPEIRADFTDYLAQVQSLDLMIGAFLAELGQAGELDNTMIVLTGDNGVGGMPRGKCNLYDLGVHAPLMIRWPAGCRPGRAIDDFTGLIDLAPTFLEAAGLRPPAVMNGRSLLPLLASSKSGQIDPSRDAAITGRELHVPGAREGGLPYPSRAIRTKDFLYIRNFKPDRWPMGAPADAPLEAVAANTMVTFADHDASPTKAWIIAHRQEAAVKRLYDLAFEKRPAEELYDLRRDPDQMNNRAADAACAKRKAELAARLMKTLRDTKDPRLEDAFDRAPYV